MPLLIDGHNLIAQVPGLSLADPDDEQQLVVLLRAYCWRMKKKGTVVFDNGQPGAPQGNWSNRVLLVRFAPPGKTADEVLRGLLAQARNPRGLVVISGDRDVAIAAQRAGAQVRAPAEFARELLATPLPPGPKETGLRPEEVASWEAEFAAKRPTKK